MVLNQKDKENKSLVANVVKKDRENESARLVRSRAPRESDKPQGEPSEPGAELLALVATSGPPVPEPEAFRPLGEAKQVTPAAHAQVQQFLAAEGIRREEQGARPTTEMGPAQEE